MKKRVWAGVLAGAFAISAAAQTAADSEQALRDAVVQKQLFMRGFSAQAEMHWRWDGTSLVQPLPTIHTLGVLTASSVAVNGDTVEIKGERRTLERGDRGQHVLSTEKDEVRIEVDLAGADRAMLLPRLSGLLFYPNVEGMLADIPDSYRTTLPAKPNEVGKSVSKECDCTDTRAECSEKGLAIGQRGMKPPWLTSKLDEKLWKEAVKRGYQGSMQFALNVNENGHAQDLWVMKPAGMGMDEVGGDVIRQGIYRPATCHGKPVEVPILVTLGSNGS